MKRAIGWVKNLDVTVGYLLLFAILVVVFLQIMSRVLPGNSISWTLEVSEMLLGALIWMNISVGVISGAHVAFDLVVRRLPRKAQKFVVMLNNAIFIVYLVLLAAFTIQGIHPHDIGTILDREGVAVRAGHHCAQPVMQRYGVPATARASFAVYNTRDEVDALIKAIWKVKELFE